MPKKEHAGLAPQDSHLLATGSSTMLQQAAFIGRTILLLLLKPLVQQETTNKTL